MITRGGTNEERLYLHNDAFDHNGEIVTIEATDMPNMRNIIHRHRARYMLAGFYTRPGMTVLDFPCGSGYGSEIIGQNTNYTGVEIDPVTVKYATKRYGNRFVSGDMTRPDLPESHYDIIACIEGIEHIDSEYQGPLVQRFYEALKPGGRLIISCPEAPAQSGPSLTNKYHRYELTNHDLECLLFSVFGYNWTILETQDTLHNNKLSTMLYGICQRGHYD